MEADQQEDRTDRSDRGWGNNQTSKRQRLASPLALHTPKHNPLSTLMEQGFAACGDGSDLS